MTIQCLWVKDAALKGHRDPESIRCHKDGKIFCRPCWDYFFGNKR